MHQPAGPLQQQQSRQHRSVLLVVWGGEKARVQGGSAMGNVPRARVARLQLLLGLLWLLCLPSRQRLALPLPRVRARAEAARPRRPQ